MATVYKQAIKVMMSYMKGNQREYVVVQLNGNQQTMIVDEKQVLLLQRKPTVFDPKYALELPLCIAELKIVLKNSLIPMIETRLNNLNETLNE